MEENEIRGVLYTDYDENTFSDVDVYPNEEGNICLRFDDKSYAILSPIMAKRFRKLLNEAIGSSVSMILGQE